MLLCDKDNICRTLNRLNALCLTFPVIALWLRSRDRKAGARKSRKFLGTDGKTLWLASNTLTNGGRLSSPPAVPKLEGGFRRPILLLEIFNRRADSSGEADIEVQL